MFKQITFLNSVREKDKPLYFSKLIIEVIQSNFLISRLKLSYLSKNH